MKKYFKYLVFALVLGTSCVDSGMYNTSIGQDSKVKYPEKTDQSSDQKKTTDGKYTYYEFDKSKESSTSDTTIKPQTKDSTIVKSKEVSDTTINKVVKVVNIPVDEKQKDSLLFALVKDKTLTEEQKSKKIDDFIKSHKKEVITFDTVISKKTVYDTIQIQSVQITPNDSLTEKQKLELQIKELQDKLDAKNNSNVEKKSETPKYSPNDLYSIGFKDAKNQYDASYVFWSVFTQGLTPIFSFYSNYLLLGSLSSLVTFLFYMFSKPKINWYSVYSEFKNDPNYKEGYTKGARSKIRLNALLGFIPGLIFIVLYLIIFTILAAAGY